MNVKEKDFQEFLEQVATSQIAPDDIIEVVNRLPQFYASWLHRKLKTEMTEISFGDKAWIYSGHVAVLDFHVNTGGKNIRFAYVGHHLSHGSGAYYLFDYGDEWEHDISVQKVTALDPKEKYPKVLKITGEIPEQYPDYDEEDEDE